MLYLQKIFNIVIQTKKKKNLTDCNFTLILFFGCGGRYVVFVPPSGIICLGNSGEGKGVCETLVAVI
jgi:hypothetical protein